MLAGVGGASGQAKDARNTRRAAALIAHLWLREVKRQLLQPAKMLFSVNAANTCSASVHTLGEQADVLLLPRSVDWSVQWVVVQERLCR